MTPSEMLTEMMDQDRELYHYAAGLKYALRLIQVASTKCAENPELQTAERFRDIAAVAELALKGALSPEESL